MDILRLEILIFEFERIFLKLQTTHPPGEPEPPNVVLIIPSTNSLKHFSDPQHRKMKRNHLEKKIKRKEKKKRNRPLLEE